MKSYRRRYEQGSTNSRCRSAHATKFCTVAPNICGSQVWNLLLVTLQAPRLLRWLLEFWKMWTPGFESLVSCCLRKCHGDLQKRTEPFFDSNSYNKISLLKEHQSSPLLSSIQISESPTVPWFSIVEIGGCLVTSVNQNILVQPSGLLYELLL